MRIRQIVLVGSVVLTFPSLAFASTTLSVQRTARLDFAGRNSPFSTPTLRVIADFFDGTTEPGTILLFTDAGRLDGSVAPIKAGGSWSHDLIVPISLFFEWPPSPILGVSDMTNPQFQQAFVMGAGFKNIADPSGMTRRLFGIDDDRLWNIGELNLTANSVPAPVALLIGSIGVGFIGWMRISKTFTV